MLGNKWLAVVLAAMCLGVTVAPVPGAPAASRVDSLADSAVAAARAGRFRQALRSVREMSGTAEDVPFNYIIVLVRAEQLKEAIKVFENLPLQPKPPDRVVRMVLECHLRRREYSAAASLYRKYLKGSVRGMDGTDRQFYAYLEEGRFDDAHQYVRDRLMRRREEIEDIMVPAPGSEVPPPPPPPVPVPADAMPSPREDLFTEGERLEARREYAAAYNIYERILRDFPGNQAALDLKYRVLIIMGSYSLASEKLAASHDRIDPELVLLLRGNEAMARVRWREPAIALRMLDHNLDYAGRIREEGGVSGDSLTTFILRTRCDRILALKELEDMPRAVAEYESVCHISPRPVSGWVRANAGNAYFCIGKPAEALAAFSDINDVQQSDPDYGKARLMVYHTLVGLGRFDDACAILDELDRASPVQVVERGILRDNWFKEEIARERGWWLLSQDRLGEAQRCFEDLRARAPNNPSIRNALAQTWLWRGYPRAALEEFEVARTLSSRDAANEIGYCYALNENGRGAEARILAQELQKKDHRSSDVRELTRNLALQDKSGIEVNGGFVNEYPGVHETDWSLRFDRPVASGRTVFAAVTHNDYVQSDLENELRRGLLGLDWRLTRDLALLGTISTDYAEGKDTGCSAQISYALGDHVSMAGLYDSFSLDTPLRARVNGINAEKWFASLQYRHSESFRVEGKSILLKMSDGNAQWSYDLAVDKSLTTRAFWKTRLALEGFSMTNSLTETPYFSPSTYYSVYVVPAVEHVWYRHPAASLVDRLYAGIGTQKEYGIERQFLWYLRYEQDLKLAGDTELRLNGGYSKQNYTGEDTDVWHAHIAVKQLF